MNEQLDVGPDFYVLEHMEISADQTSYHAEDLRIVGYFSSEAAVMQAVALLRTKPGFRDWPEGFRWHGHFADHVAYPGSGYGRPLTEFGDALRDEDFPDPDILETLHEVTHFRRLRPGEEPRTYPDRLAPWHVGAYTSLALAEAVIAVVRTNEDLAPWPDGFRIVERRMDEIAWPDGYDPSEPS